MIVFEHLSTLLDLFDALGQGQLAPGFVSPAGKIYFAVKRLALIIRKLADQRLIVRIDDFEPHTVSSAWNELTDFASVFGLRSRLDMEGDFDFFADREIAAVVDPEIAAVDRPLGLGMQRGFSIGGLVVREREGQFNPVSMAFDC